MTDCLSPISAQTDLFNTIFPENADIHDPLPEFVDALNLTQGEASEIIGATTLIGRSQIYNADASDILPRIEGESVDLVVTSLRECHRVLRPDGGMCWQVGNYVGDGEVLPIDSIIIPIFRELGIGPQSRTTTPSIWIQSESPRNTPKRSTIKARRKEN